MRCCAALASSWEQSAPPSEDLLIPFISTDNGFQIGFVSLCDRPDPKKLWRQGTIR
jgi:hypothetical protein